MSINLAYHLTVFKHKINTENGGMAMADDKLRIKSKRKLHGEDGYSVFSIRVRTELKEKIDQIATDSGYSRNSLIELFLEYAADRCEITEK